MGIKLALKDPDAMAKNKDSAGIELELFRDLINRSDDAIFVADPPTGLFVFVNDKACSGLGYDRRELLGMGVRDIETCLPDDFSWQEHVNELRRKGSLMFEGLHKRKDGSTFPVEANISHVALKKKEYLVTVVRDITERKQAEGVMRFQSEIATNISEGIYLVSAKDLRILYANPRMEEIFGYVPGEMNGKHVSIINAPSGGDPGKTADRIEKTLRETGRWSGELCNIRKDGTTFWGHASVSVLHHPDYGDVYLSLQSDIDERKRAEAALSSSEERFRHLFEDSPVSMWEEDISELQAYIGALRTAGVTDLDAYLEDRPGEVLKCAELVKVISVNRTTLDVYEAPDEGALLSDLSRVFTARSLDAFRGILVALSKGEQMYECEAVNQTLTGKTIDVLLRWSLISGDRSSRSRALISVVDITESKRAEAALRVREKQLAESQRIAHVGSWEHNLKTGDVFWSDELFRLFGLDPETDPADFRVFFEMIHPDEKPLLKKSIDKALRGEKPFSIDYRFIVKDGMTRIIHAQAELVCDEAGDPVILSGTAQDITERKKAEERIRESEEFIRSILDTVDEGFIVVDPDFRILTANKAYCDQLGVCDEEITGRHCYEMSHRTSRPCHEQGEDCVVRLVFADGQPHGAIHRHADRDGHLLFVETKGYPIKDASGNVTSVIETVNNITEKHLLEEERLKSQKLESIGTLAGGLAHDFNNLLQGIFGYISMAKTSLEQKEKALRMLEESENALEQAVSLTKQLLTFSRGGRPVKKRISLLPVIDNAAKFALSGSRSGYRLDIEPDLWHVDADAGQLGQVIQNMVLNAEQAMPEGGNVIITARNVGRADKCHAELAAGTHVEISIQDSGIGIPEKYLPKIFDPYFTTKEKGSGLGLATSYSIIRSHGGVISVFSVPGNGTTFYIYLPAVGTREEIREKVQDPPPVVRGRVLVMDDDEVVRTVAGQFLTLLNHEAEFAEDGEAAIRKYREAQERKHPFDVVVLDLTVRGGMGGKETMERLVDMDPDVKAIVSTGYSDDAVVADYQKYGFMARLTKPYDLEDLRNTLNALMCSKRAP